MITSPLVINLCDMNTPSLNKSARWLVWRRRPSQSLLLLKPSFINISFFKGNILFHLFYFFKFSI